MRSMVLAFKYSLTKVCVLFFFPLGVWRELLCSSRIYTHHITIFVLEFRDTAFCKE